LDIDFSKGRDIDHADAASGLGHLPADRPVDVDLHSAFVVTQIVLRAHPLSGLDEDSAVLGVPFMHGGTPRR
jgi:hypothetical protein